jgi:hypothetical protein
MLEIYLNQTAVYKAKTGNDARGQPTYSAEKTIPCRMQSKAQAVLTTTGRTVVPQHTYYTMQEIKEGDMLDGKIIKAVSTQTGLNGEILGYKGVML